MTLFIIKLMYKHAEPVTKLLAWIAIIANAAERARSRDLLSTVIWDFQNMMNRSDSARL